MSQENLVRQVLLTTSTRKRPRGCPSTGWSDYTSDFAWSRLSVVLAVLPEIAIDHEVFPVLLGLIPPRLSTKEKRIQNSIKNDYFPATNSIKIT